MLRSVVGLVSLAIALTAIGCSRTTGPDCGEGADPVVVTGLNGLVDDEVPAVEVQLRVPDSCEVLDTRWMTWDEAGQTVALGGEPAGEYIARDAVMVSDDVIYFTDENLGVRLVYPEGEAGPELALVWFSASTDLVTVDCAAEGEALACAVREP